MSEANGKSGKRIIDIGDEGLAEVKIGTQRKSFTIDVIDVFNEWCEKDRSLRNEEGVVPPELVKEWNQMQWQFVRDLAVKASGDENYFKPDDGPSLGQAFGFITKIVEATGEIRRFFAPNTPEKASSPGSSTELRFSP